MLLIIYFDFENFAFLSGYIFSQLFDICILYLKNTFVGPGVISLSIRSFLSDMIIFVASGLPFSLFFLIKISPIIVVVLLLSASSKMQNCRHGKSRTNFSFPIPDFLLIYALSFQRTFIKTFCRSPILI